MSLVCSVCKASACTCKIGRSLITIYLSHEVQDQKNKAENNAITFKTNI